MEMSINLDNHFGPEDKQILLDAFLGNELDSDQYREAWPEADAARESLTIVFEDRWKAGEAPLELPPRYDDDLHDIKLYLAELKS